MNKPLILLVVALNAFLHSSSQLKKIPDNCTVKANLINWNNSNVSIIVDGEPIYEDSLTNGEFEYKTKIKGPKEGYLIIQTKSVKVKLLIYLEAGIIRIRDQGKNIIGFDVIGTSNNQSLNQFKNNLDSTYPLKPSFNNIEYESQLVNRRSYTVQFIKEHHFSLITLELFRRYILNSDIPNDEKLFLFNFIDKQIKITFGGKELLRNINSLINTSIGRKAPVFSQKDTANKTYSLQNFEGNYVLLDFWASWCVPCLEDLELIKPVYQKFKDRGFTILSISLDTDKTKWISAIVKNQLTWTHLSDLKGWLNNVAQLYYIKSLPSNFLLDPKGYILDINISGAKLESRLDSLYKTNK